METCLQRHKSITCSLITANVDQYFVAILDSPKCKYITLDIPVYFLYCMYSSCEARIYSTVIILMEGVYMYTVNICINVYVFNKFTQEVWNRLLGKDVQYWPQLTHTKPWEHPGCCRRRRRPPLLRKASRTTKIKLGKTISLFRIVIDVAAAAL